jgi:isopenicillin N synthase-like dioxygenase
MVDNVTHHALPPLILDHKPLVSRYMRAAHTAGVRILEVLGARLGLPAGEMARHHRIGRESGDHVRLTRGPPRRSADLPEIQTPGHTDFGTITVLWNWLGGLQVWSDSSRGETGFTNILDPATGGSAEWLWVVPPGPGRAIVNLGDAAVKFTGGMFCSGRHRVVPAPGVQGQFPRYSIVYFVRPEDDIVLKKLKASGIPDGGDDEGDGITAKEWIIQQSAALGNSIKRS